MGTEEAPVMHELAAWVRRAHLGDALPAAGELMQRYPNVALALMDYASVTLSEIEDFEQRYATPVLIEGVWGRFWLVPQHPRRLLMPPAPMLTMRGLRALALAILDHAAAA